MDRQEEQIAHEPNVITPANLPNLRNLERLAQGAGIPVTATVRDPDAVTAQASAMLGDGKPGFLCVKVEPGLFRDFPPERVKMTDGIEDKYAFIRHVERQEKIVIRSPVVAD